MVASPTPNRRPPVPFELLNNPTADPDAWNAAWNALIDAYTPMLRRYVKRIAGGANWHDVEDIVEDTWVRVQQRLSGLRDVDAFEGWVRTIAKNLWLQHVRRAKSSSRFDEPDDFVLRDYPDPRSAVEAVLGKADLYQQVYARLDNPNYQAYLEEKVIEGLTHAELATRRNITEAGSKKIWNRLRKRIESILRDLGVDGYDAA